MSKADRPAPARERRWYFAFPVTLWVLGAFILTAFIVGVLSRTLAPLLYGGGLRIDQNVYGVVLSFVIYAVVLGLVLGVPRLLRLWSARIPYRELLGLTRLMTWRDIGFALAGALVYQAAAVMLILALQRLVPGFDAGQKQETGFSNTLSPVNAVLVFFVLVVLAPIAEELIFRGYLFGTLRRCVPLVAAAVITSALFGLVHGQWNVAVDVFVLSLVSCYLRVRTGALWSSFLLHMAKNAFAFYMLYVATRSIM